MACRLCLKLGIEDPEQWLEDVPDRVFDLWDAYYSLEPWGQEQERLADVGSVVMASLLSSGVDAKEAVQAVDKLRAVRMPAEWIDQPEQVDSADNLASVETMAAKQFGA